MKYYLVEFLNELTLARQYVQAEGNNAQAAVDLARERVDEQANWTVANVWEETQEAWDEQEYLAVKNVWDETQETWK